MYPHVGICRHYSVGAETPSTRRHATIQCPSEGGPPARPPRPPEMGVLELFGRRGPPWRGRPGSPAQTPGTPGLQQSLGHCTLCWNMCRVAAYADIIPCAETPSACYIMLEHVPTCRNMPTLFRVPSCYLPQNTLCRHTTYAGGMSAYAGICRDVTCYSGTLG